jgi:periplasmic divalent cation tolerance protein
LILSQERRQREKSHGIKDIRAGPGLRRVKVMEYVVIFITAPDEEEAARIARTIVEERLAGCVNIIKGVRSIYSWEGKVEDEDEVLMVVKTKKTLFSAVEKRVKELHSYSVPEIISIPLIEGSEEYLKWLKHELMR